MTAGIRLQISCPRPHQQQNHQKLQCIVSASRSPPGLCSNLRSSVRVPTEYTFRVTFRIIFGPFGIIFEACLGPWGHFGGAVGSLFESKISFGLQRCPKWRHPGNKVTLLETFWSSFFTFFHFCGSEIGDFFSSIFWSPSALQGMGSYAIRTRRRSPKTLFHFHTFSKKMLPTDRILGPFWRQFSSKI